MQHFDHRLFELTPIESLFSSGSYGNGTATFTVHRAGMYTVLYADKGAGRHSVDFNEHVIHPGAFLFIGPRQVMQFDRSRSYGGYLLRFSADFIHPLGKREEVKAIACLFDHAKGAVAIDARRHRDIITFFELVKREIDHAKDAVHSEIIRASLELMLLHTARLVTPPSREENNAGFEYFRLFRRMLSDEVELGRNALDYAHHIGISYKYLNDLCKKYAGLTAKEMIDGELLSESKRKLILEGHSVSSVARELGFDDTSNFRKYFRKFTGTTPGEFRTRVG